MSVERDTIEEFLRVIDNTAGRDRLARLLQFYAKYQKWQEEQQQKPNHEFIQMYNSIQSTMGTVRKVLRLFRWWGLLRNIKNSIPADSSKIDLIYLLNTSAKLSLATYFLSDHFVLAKNLLIWKPSKDISEKITYTTDAFWLSEIILTSLEMIVRLYQLSSVKDTLAIITQRSAYQRTLFRYLLDLPIALNLLKLTGKTPDGVFGALGVVTSLLGFYDTWPTITVPAPAGAVAVAKKA